MKLLKRKKENEKEEVEIAADQELKTEDKEHEKIRPPHKLIGFMGLILLILYIILAFIYEPFTLITKRFIAMFTAITKNYALAYSLVPIYMNWVSSDYFQERRKTTLGNAATNGFMGFWVCFDWMRISYIKFDINPNSFLFAGKIILATLMFLYGFWIVKAAAQGKRIAHFIGKVREISYLAIMVTPIVYEVIPFDLVTIVAIIVFFPLFHGFIEFLEYFLLPIPGTETPEDKEIEGL